jgi:hypothetical protein
MIKTLVLMLVVSVTWKPEYAQLNPELRQWFRDQKNPTTKVPCCSEADGSQAREDIRGEHYWVRFEARGIDSEWMPVPDETIIRGANRNGAPIVWWYFDNGVQNLANLRIRCFVPGPGL